MHIAVINATAHGLDFLWQPLAHESAYAFFPMDVPGPNETFASKGVDFCWTHRCHLVLIDLRNGSARPQLIELAERLHATTRIITVGGLTPDMHDLAVWARLFREQIVFEDLAEDITAPTTTCALRQALENAWSDRTWRNPGLQIFPESLVADFRIAEILQIEAERELDQQLRHLLERLFCDAEQLQVEPMGALNPGASAKTAHSVVLKITEKRQGKWLRKNPRVLKINRVSRGDFDGNPHYSEEQRYRQYVEQRIDYDLHARLIESRSFWDVSGSLYQFQGNAVEDFRTFRDFFIQTSSHEIDRINNVIDNLFRRTLHNWHIVPEQRDPQNTFVLMAAYLQLHKRVEHARSQPCDLPLPLMGELPLLADPLAWITQHGFPDTPFNTHVAHECICHGDLHGGNVLVDRHGQAWLIDFEKTGPAPILRDFVELETDIKLRLSEIDPDDHKTALALDVALLKYTSCREVPTANARVREHVGAMKAFQAIITLRRFALDRADPNDMAEYYWALLAETAFVSLYHRERPATRARAHLSASLICDRLANWNQLDWSRTWQKQCPWLTA